MLVGLMGVGKTTVGKECARRLGRSFVDLDELIMDFARRCLAGEAGEAGEVAQGVAGELSPTVPHALPNAASAG